MPPWEKYSASEGPWSRYAAKAEKPRGKGIGRKVDAAVRGAADFLSFGLADELQAGAEALPALAGGADAYNREYRQRLDGQKARDEADKREVPNSRRTGQALGLASSLGVGAVTNVGRLVPRLAPNAGRAVRAAETTARNVFAGAGYGAIAGAGSSEAGLNNRVQGAAQGATAGAVLGAAAAPLAAVGGQVIEGTANMFAPAARKAVRRLANAGSDVATMRRTAREYVDSGISPTLTDATDEAGRGVIRAAASRMTPGRQRAQDFASGRALDLPDRMSGQARRTMSADPRTPGEIATEVGNRRRTAADQAFSAVRNEPVQATDDLVLALRTPAAREAVAEAVRRERDPQVRAALSRLQGNAFDNPADLELTVGMADRVSRVLNGKAQAAAQSGDGDLATTLGGLGRAIRSPARSVPGYGDALDGYAAESRVMEAADRGQDFLTRNTDEFVADTANLAPDERAVALATARRAVERASGESVASAPGVARRLSTAPEQMARNRALMGNEQANIFQRGMQMEERAVQNASQIAPRSGSKTANQMQDAAQLGGMIDTGVKVARAAGGNVGVALDFLRSRGMSDAEANALVEIATDPRRLDEAFRLIEQRVGTEAAQQFVQAVSRQAGARNAGEGAAR